MHKFTQSELEKYASGKGVKRVAVENFLSSLDPGSGAFGNTINLHEDARMYKWNEVTVRTIEAGIRAAFSPKNMGKFGSALTKEHIINGQKYHMWGFDTKSKASANQQADQLRRHGKDVIVIESKNPDLIKGWIIFAKNRRGRRIGGFGETATTTSNARHITNINEFWSRHNGKTVTLNGVAYKIKYSEFNAIHPYKHVAVSIFLDPVNKRSEYYLKIKRELGDDWSMDAKDISDIALIKILNQLER